MPLGTLLLVVAAFAAGAAFAWWGRGLDVTAAQAREDEAKSAAAAAQEAQAAARAELEIAARKLKSAYSEIEMWSAEVRRQREILQARDDTSTSIQNECDRLYIENAALQGQLAGARARAKRKEKSPKLSPTRPHAVQGDSITPVQLPRKPNQTDELF